MSKRSNLGLIERELEAFEGGLNAWEQFLYIRAKNRNVKLNVTIPARAYLRTMTLLEHLDCPYEVNLTDIFEMLSDNATNQYGKEVNARTLYATMKTMQSSSKLVQNGEITTISYDDPDITAATISLPYKFVLRLEWMMDDIFAATGFTVTVEEYLSVLFADFTRRLKAGEVADIAKQITNHLERGETA